MSYVTEEQRVADVLYRDLAHIATMRASVDAVLAGIRTVAAVAHTYEAVEAAKKLANELSDLRFAVEDERERQLQTHREKTLTV